MEESTLNKDLCSASATSEESGWTIYFDDFLASQQEINSASPPIAKTSINSLVPDAASHVATKSAVKAELSLKKRKGRGVSILVDDSLEDTACSPVKVGLMEEDAKVFLR